MVFSAGLLRVLLICWVCGGWVCHLVMVLLFCGDQFCHLIEISPVIYQRIAKPVMSTQVVYC